MYLDFDTEYYLYQSPELKLYVVIQLVSLHFPNDPKEEISFDFKILSPIESSRTLTQSQVRAIFNHAVLYVGQLRLPNQ